MGVGPCQVEIQIFFTRVLIKVFFGTDRAVNVVFIAVILFTYTLDVNTTANMACYRTYEDIDLGGGLSIYAKANVEAYVELQLTLDGDNDEVYVTHIKTSTDGKTYTIPFSAFWKRDDKSVGIDTTSDHTHTITQMVFVTGYGITPPVVGVDASGSILVDDIQYTNSQKEIARPESSTDLPFMFSTITSNIV